MKLILVGNGHRGKTEWVYRLLGRKPYDTYIPTQGIEVHPFGLSIKIWDTAGDTRYSGMNDGYYKNAKITFIFADNEDEADIWINKITDSGIKKYMIFAKLENIDNFSSFLLQGRMVINKDDEAFSRYIVNNL